ncbi:hypothetical protein ONZ51_g12108 [Trametes cubensis]|uniref:3-carboxymuconate cyclase n=1 Tax=Trametes cubensis TaxID=1111947 RepID=A0AAD7X4W3_9APHY|nr:hypothetical protein ONZ51_g12108 [Trametes cubensis]
MQLSFAALASILAASSLVSAVPLQRRGTKMMTSKTRFNAAGAVYFITNEPSENMIIAASINSDGTLSLDRAVSTGGHGAHGITDPLGPDALFSQGAIKASAKGQVLATVNPGSNTVSLFSIDPNTPTNIQPLGDPISSEGEFPMSLAFNSDGSRLCVLNGGTVNGVICYNVDKKTGLSAMSNTLRSLGLNQTTPATGPPWNCQPPRLQRGRQAAARLRQGCPAEPRLSRPPSGGLLPFSMTVVPGKNAVLSTDPGIGFDVFDLSGGNSSSAVAIDGQSATCWSSFSTKTGNFYLTDIGTSIVTEVNIDDNLKASIVKQYPQTNGSSTIDNDIATVNGKDFMYVLAPGTQSVEVLSLDAPGNAQHVQSLQISGPAKASGVTISTNNLQGMTSFIRQ